MISNVFKKITIVIISLICISGSLGVFYQYFSDRNDRSQNAFRVDEAMKKVAVFTSNFKENALRNSGTVEFLDFYDMSSYEKLNIESKNPVMNMLIKAMPFYMLFGASDQKYDSVFFLSDFPLYNCDASRFIIHQAHIKSHSVFFHPHHRQVLEDLGFKLEVTARLYGDGFLKITKGNTEEILNNTFGKEDRRKFHTIYNNIQDGSYFEDMYQHKSSFPYSYVGAYYKAHAIVNILNHYNMKDKATDFLDLGSGASLIALELLFHFSHLQDVSIDCVDKGISISEKALRTPFFKSLSSKEFLSLSSDQKAYLTRQSYINEIRSYLPKHLIKGFQYFEQPMEKFNFSKQYDVIYLIGSLLYLPREEVLPFLKKVMKHLKPGGVLCIHENIKNPNYTKNSQYQYMFEAAELDDYLMQLGSISYFHNTSGYHLKKEVVKDNTVFRVIQKMGSVPKNN